MRLAQVKDIGQQAMLPVQPFQILVIRLFGLQALSAVGRCQTFEAAADGYGRGEGCTVILLQPASTADNNIAILQVITMETFRPLV